MKASYFIKRALAELGIEGEQADVLANAIAIRLREEELKRFERLERAKLAEAKARYRAAALERRATAFPPPTLPLMYRGANDVKSFFVGLAVGAILVAAVAMMVVML